jgi:hypothetical protein
VSAAARPRAAVGVAAVTLLCLSQEHSLKDYLDSSGGWGRSAGLLRALSHAGLPHGQFGLGGEHFSKRFELGEDHGLRVLVSHDSDLMRAVADGRAVRE